MAVHMSAGMRCMPLCDHYEGNAAKYVDIAHFAASNADVCRCLLRGRPGNLVEAAFALRKYEGYVCSL